MKLLHFLVIATLLLYASNINAQSNKNYIGFGVSSNLQYLNHNVDYLKTLQIIFQPTDIWF